MPFSENWALKYDMETNGENLPNNNQKRFQQCQGPYSRFSCYSYVRVEKIYIYNSPFDLDALHIERCDIHVTQAKLTKTHLEHHHNMHNNINQDFIDYS